MLDLFTLGLFRAHRAAVGFAFLTGLSGYRCGESYAQQPITPPVVTGQAVTGQTEAVVETAMLDESRFGYAAALSRNAMIASRLADANAVDVAYEFLSRQLELPRADLDAAVADGMELVRLETSRRIGAAAITSASIEQLFEETIEPSSRLAERLAERISSPSSSDSGAAAVLPSPREVALMLDFAVERNRVELTRYLVAASAATVGNQQLLRKAALSVDLCREKLELLREAAGRRASELSTLRTADAMRWRNELYRLANEALLLSIDVATMQLDAAADESAAVRAATALLNDVESTSEVFASTGGAPPMLLALRARAIAVLGRREEAVQSLSKAIDSAAAPALRRQLQLSLLDVLLGSDDAADSSDAASLLRELLAEGDISPPLSLAILRYQLERLQGGGGASGEGRPGSDIALDRGSLASMISRPANRTDVIVLRDAIATRFGDHWRWRSDALILRMLPRSANSDNADSSGGPGDYAFVDAQVAQDLLAGRLDAAVAALAAAEQQARSSGGQAIAFDFAKKRSALLHAAFAKRADEVAGGEQVLAARLALAEQTCRTAAEYTHLPGAADLHFLGLRTAVEAVGPTENAVALAAVTSLSGNHLAAFPGDPRNASIAETVEAMYLRRGDFIGAVAFVDRWLTAATEQAGRVPSDAPGSADAVLAAEHRVTLRLLQTALSPATCTEPPPGSWPASVETILELQESALASVAPEGPVVSPHLHREPSAIKKERSVDGAVDGTADLVRLRSFLAARQANDGTGSSPLPSEQELTAYLGSLAEMKPQRHIATLALLTVDWAELLYHRGPDADGVAGFAELIGAMQTEANADGKTTAGGPLLVAVRGRLEDLLRRSNALLAGYRGDWSSAAAELLAMSEKDPSADNLHWLARALTGAGTGPAKPSALLRSLRSRTPASTACWWRLTADLAVASAGGSRDASDAVSFLLATAAAPPPGWTDYVSGRASRLSSGDK